MIYLVADDLTGATDTGVQFSKQGYNTLVTIVDLNIKNNKTLNINSDTDIFVVDSETRDLSIMEARKRILQIVNQIPVNENDVIYKKVDSTLRGNIGVELDIIMNKFEKDICLFCPAFPSNNRFVIGGYLIVQGEPLGVTEYYRGNLDSGNASYIPVLLKKQSNLPVGKVELKDVIQGKETILKRINYLYKRGKKIIILDALNDQHLKDILLSGNEFNGSVLYSGSAGLANYLSKIYKTDSSLDLDNNQQIDSETFLIVGGSRRNIMNSQINYLKNKLDINEITIDLKNVFSTRKKSLADYISEGERAIKSKQLLVIRPDPSFLEKNMMQNIINENNLQNHRELEVIIRNFLGELTASLINKSFINNLVLIGGDTAIGVCKALGVDSLRIVDEILPGIPVSSIRNHRYSKIKIATKAGGFGQEETLYNLLMKLHYHNKMEVKGFLKPGVNG